MWIFRIDDSKSIHAAANFVWRIADGSAVNRTYGAYYLATTLIQGWNCKETARTPAYDVIPLNHLEMR